MKKIFIILLLLLSIIAIADNKVNCNQGNQDPAQRDPHEEPGGDAEFAGQTSVDPNEIIGPQGYDTLQWVSINDVLNYTIYFENDPVFATANAQRVDVRFDFDKKELMKDFILGSYGFANMSWDIEKPSNTYQTRLNLIDTMSIYVDLIAGLDVTKKQAFWKFSSIDPESGFAPWQSDRGMLPVNDSTHVGEGFVRFSIKPYSTMKTGDTISIQANIVFDQNDTIPTNRWKNVIDAGNPTSRVVSTPNAQNAGHYNLTFEAADDEKGSGIKQIRLYLANQFGVYEEFAVCPADTTIDFVPEAGRKYEFYSLAEDNVGNREDLKEQPDMVLDNNTAPTDIELSTTTFQDDIAAEGFIAEISSVDTDENGEFTYALAEGDGAIHNDFFQINGTQLQARECFKCAEESVYKIRLSTTDKDGLSFSKAFTLNMEKVLVKPEEVTLNIDICEGETCILNGVEYDKTGLYKSSKENEFMCDSLYVLNLRVLPKQEVPLVTIEGSKTLVSSADNNNQWFSQDGTPIKDATSKKFTPDKDGIYYVAVSNGACYSEPSLTYEVKVSDDVNLELDLKKGWNWVSSNLSEADNKDAKQFLNPIEAATERFVGVMDELINDPVYGLTGGLTTIAPQDGYKLKVSENISHAWTGIGSNPETTTMKLHKGWNWIGYVPLGSHGLENALANLTPAENDVVKAIDDFSTFTGGKWVGTLTQMKPGEGYMYYATNAAEFTYPATRVFPVMDEPSPSRVNVRRLGPWNYDANGYPDNTTVIGQLFVDGAPTVEGAYTVGAFCGDECRGVGKYVGDILFMTIHGTLSTDQQVTFKAWENATGNEYAISETIMFQGQQEGSYQNPMALHVNGTTDIAQTLTTGYTVYPKPLRSRLYINGDTEHIKTIKVLSSDGALNLAQNGYSDQGIDVSGLQSGVYVVAIVLTDGKVYYEKVIKATNN